MDFAVFQQKIEREEWQNCWLTKKPMNAAYRPIKKAASQAVEALNVKYWPKKRPQRQHNRSRGRRTEITDCQSVGRSQYKQATEAENSRLTSEIETIELTNVQKLDLLEKENVMSKIEKDKQF